MTPSQLEALAARVDDLDVRIDRLIDNPNKLPVSSQAIAISMAITLAQGTGLLREVAAALRARALATTAAKSGEAG